MNVSQFDKLPYGTELVDDKGNTYFKMKNNGFLCTLFNPKDGEAWHFGSVKNFSIKKQVELSPDFDYDNYETILEWAKKKYNAKLEYDDVFISHGEEVSYPEMGVFYLSWDFGTMDFGRDEQKARKEAAMFIYLWTRGVDVITASSCSQLYVEHVKIINL